MFSVVIPLYNKAATIARALASVARQQTPAAEVIVVNDGSTDGGEAALAVLPNLRVVNQSNQGVSCARNAGIALARQPFIAFLDADDEWTPDFLEIIGRAIKRFPDAGLYGTGFVTVSGGRILTRYGIGGRGFREIDFFAEWRRRHVFCASSIVVPKAVFCECGGFSPGVAITEDSELYYKVALAHPVVAAADFCARYDVSVPGQAVSRWRSNSDPDFTVQQHHMFLTEALGEPVSRSKSFRHYCRSEFRIALLARLAWGDFAALGAYYRMPGVRQAVGLLDRSVCDAMTALPVGGWLARSLRKLHVLRHGWQRNPF